MKNRILSCVLFICLSVCGVVYAQEGLTSNVEQVVAKMTKDLNLTAEQVTAVKAILTEYLKQRQAIMEEADEPMAMSEAKKEAALMALKEEEDQKLNEVLTPEQMNKLHDKDKMRRQLNNDKVDFKDHLWGNSGSSGGQPSSTMQF